MKILRHTYDVLCSLPCAPPETGGILGGKSGIISTYDIDLGLDTFDNYDHYHPNVKKLNQVISDWVKQGISFYGLFHSHFPGGEQLSFGDQKYIFQIMMTMPQEVNELFFPIILPNGMMGYRASRCGSEIHICRDDIKII